MSARRFFTGNSGVSTAPHLHAALFDPQTGQYLDPHAYLSALLVGGKPITERFAITSPFGPRPKPRPDASSDHRGIDLGTPEGTEVEVAGGRWLKTEDQSGYGRLALYDWTAPNGKALRWKLAHGDPRRNPLGLAQEAAATGDQVSLTAETQVSAPAPAPPPVPDWRAAASDPARSRNPLEAAYWQREDIRQWAAANPKLAAPLLRAAGVSSTAAELLPVAEAPAAPIPQAVVDGELSFRPLDRGALRGVQVTPLPSARAWRQP